MLGCKAELVPHASRPRWFVWLAVMLLAGIGLAATMPRLQAAHAASDVTECKKNEKNIGTALEMYSTDNSGRYPTSLDRLTPNYLRVIPTCPAGGKDTYTVGLVSTSNPDAYTVVCAGVRHPLLLGQNYPQYTSVQGLIAMGDPSEAPPSSRPAAPPQPPAAPRRTASRRIAPTVKSSRTRP